MCCVLFLKTYKKKSEIRVENSENPTQRGWREGWKWLRSSALSSCVYSWVLNPQKQKAKSHPQDSTPIKWFIIARGFHGCFPSSGRKLTTKFHPGTSTKSLVFRFKTFARNSESIWIFFLDKSKGTLPHWVEVGYSSLDICHIDERICTFVLQFPLKGLSAFLDLLIKMLMKFLIKTKEGVQFTACGLVCTECSTGPLWPG